MALTLKHVDPTRGLRWVRDGFALFARRPLAFASMFVLFLMAALLLSLMPTLGGVLQMMMLPLLSLGFMVAAQSALLGGPVGPSQFIEPLRADAGKRRKLLLLCAIYGISAVAILLLCDHVSNNALHRLQMLMAKADAKPEDVYALLAEPGVFWGSVIASVLGSLLSVLFWHAPALVHWAGQGVAQAIYISTLAVWRSKGAFTVYATVWMLLVMLFGLVTALFFDLIGLRQMASAVALPSALLFSTVFYISVLFTFNDSFGGAAAATSDTIDSETTS